MEIRHDKEGYRNRNTVTSTRKAGMINESIAIGLVLEEIENVGDETAVSRCQVRYYPVYFSVALVYPSRRPLLRH